MFFSISRCYKVYWVAVACIHKPRKLGGPCGWVSPSAFLVPIVASVASASLYTYGLPMATKKILEEEDRHGINRNNCMHSYFLAGCPSICVSVRKTSEESPSASILTGRTRTMIQDLNFEALGSLFGGAKISQMGVSIHGGLQNGKNLLQWDDLGVPYFRKPPSDFYES